MSRFFDLMDDRRYPGRWHLGSPVNEQGRPIDPWQFKSGELLDLGGQPRFPLKIPGRPLDFSWAGFTIPLVHDRLARLVERVAGREVQFIPAQVEGHPEPWFILNALRIIRCIDDARCEEVQYWIPEDGRPEKVGEYRDVAGMRIDPAKVRDARIFRPWGWTVALIISEDLKQAMEAEGITGTRFVEV